MNEVVDSVSDEALPMEGFTDTGWKYLQKICRFDSMDDVTFESGLLPKTIQYLSASDIGFLEAFTVPVIGSPYFPIDSCLLSEYEYFDLDAVASKVALEGTVFAIAPKRIRPHVEDVILQIAIDDLRMGLVESARFRESYFSSIRWQNDGINEEIWERDRPVGWIELDNGYIFTTDKKMFLDFCAMFSVSIPSRSELRVDMPDFAEVDSALREVSYCFGSPK